MKGVAIIAAAGKGERAHADKVWIKIAGKTVLERAAEPFFSCPTVDAVILVVAEAHEEEAKALFAGREIPCFVVVGGATRSESVARALKKATELFGDEDAVVAVHDGARPYVTRELIARSMTLAAAKGSAVPALPCSDSLRKVDGEGSKAIPREEIVRVQTPQCFSLRALVKAYSYGEEATDDATLYERHIAPITLTEGDENNIKITYLSDIYKDNFSRVGVGYDVHPLRAGRLLILGGVKIPHDKGLDGHSDADVLTHAIMDALLTAAGLPDIGHLFPPDDPAYEGADSVLLLKEVMRRVKEAGFTPRNIAATILAEKPKLAPHLPVMEEVIAKVTGLKKGEVTFAATTTEKLGIIGEEKGIAAEAIALLSREGDRLDL